MTDFVPPKPKPHKRKLSPHRRILEVRHSSISVLFDRSYSMHFGDVGSECPADAGVADGEGCPFHK